MTKNNLNQNLEIKYELMQKDINHINQSVDEIKDYIKEDIEWKAKFCDKLDLRYVSNQKFEGLSLIVYGIVAVLSFTAVFLVNYFIK